MDRSNNLHIVKRQAISVLTTVYKTNSEDQVAELESKIQDLLDLIHLSEDGRTTNTLGIANKSNPSTMGCRIAEIEKPLKKFSERPNDNARQQVGFLEDAIRDRRDRKLKWLHLDKVVPGGFEASSAQEKKRMRKGKSVPIHIEADQEADDDDMSSIGTASTYVSLADRVAELFFVKKFIEQEQHGTTLQAVEEGTSLSSQHNYQGDKSSKLEEHHVEERGWRWRWHRTLPQHDDGDDSSSISEENPEEQLPTSWAWRAWRRRHAQEHTDDSTTEDSQSTPTGEKEVRWAWRGRFTNNDSSSTLQESSEPEPRWRWGRRQGNKKTSPDSKDINVEEEELTDATSTEQSSSEDEANNSEMTDCYDSDGDEDDTPASILYM